MALLGIDAGITGVKAVVFGVDGKMLSSAYREYPLHQPRPGWAELAPGEIWAAAAEVISCSARDAGEEITALAVSSMGEAAAPVGRDGKALANIIAPIDGRSAAIAAELEKKVGRKRYFQITGLTPHPCYTAYHMLWWRENAAEVFGKVWKFICMQDYIGYRLTGRAAMDHSMACRTGLFDVRRRQWSEELFDAAGLAPEMLSAPQAPGTVVGNVRWEIAGELGLSKRTVVVTGGHDQPVCAIGAGATSEGVADLSLGTVECLTNTHKEAMLTDEVLAHNFPVYCHALPGHYTTLGYNFTSGGLLRWYRDNFAAEEAAAARREGRSVYDVLFDEIEDGFTDVLVVPHLVGTGTPYLDPLAQGAIVNLSLSTTRQEIFLACAQGAVLEFMLNYRVMGECGLAPHAINAIGGGARSSKWLQMRSDAIGTPVNRMGVEEAGCAGAAVLAGLGTGVYADATEGAAAFARVETTFTPRADRRERWETLYRKYRGLYEALKPFRV